MASSGEGMNLRDWLAGKEVTGNSLEGLQIGAWEKLSGMRKPEGGWEDNPVAWFEFEAAVIARIKYMRADAMLAERAKQ